MRLQLMYAGSSPPGKTSPPNIRLWPEGQHRKLLTLKTEPLAERNKPTMIQREAYFSFQIFQLDMLL